MDVPKDKRPPVMRPSQFGQSSSHTTHRPAPLPQGKGKGWGLMSRLGIGGAKIL